MSQPPRPCRAGAATPTVRLRAGGGIISLGFMRIHCPMCGKVLDDVPQDYAPRPFCSPRCKLADLSNWMNEEYRISRALTDEELDQETTH